MSVQAGFTPRDELSPPANPVRPFRGWSVLAGGFVNVLLLIGATTYSFGLFVLPMQAEFDLTREQAYFGYSVMMIGAMVWAPIIGQLIDRFAVRRIVMLSGFVFASGFAAISVARSPEVVAIALFFLVSLGIQMGGTLPSSAIVTRWFVVRRGRAMGLLSIGTSVGGFLVVPVFTLLIMQWGWRPATLWMGLGVGALVSLSALLILRDRPSDVGQLPDGAERGAAPPQAAPRAPLRGVLKLRNFWMIGLGAGILLGTDQAMLASLIPYGADRGFPPDRGASLMAVLTISAIVGKLTIGWLAERVDKRYLFLVVAMLNVALLALLVLDPSYEVLLAGVALLGTAIGGVYPLWTTMTADAFGQATYGTAFGAMMFLAAIGGLLAVALTGRLYEMTGGYDVAFQSFILLDVVAAVLIWQVNTRMRADGAAGGNA